MNKIERITRTPDNDAWYVRPAIPQGMSELDKAWADIYWTFAHDDMAFDLSDNHIGQTTCPVPFSNSKYFETYAEVPF